MKYRLSLALTVSLLFLFILTACSGESSESTSGSSEKSTSDSPESTQRLAIATGSTGGTFFPLGTGMAEMVSDNVETLEVNAESTGGSVENVALIDKGDTNLGIVDMSVAHTAFEGIGDFDTPHQNLRGLFTGYGQMIHLLVKNGSPIENVKDLKGKVISIGPSGSGTATVSKVLFESLGIWDDITVEYMTHEQESLALGDGRIDAATYSLGIPGSSVTEFMTSHDGKIIPIESEVTEIIQEEHPYFLELSIPAGTYPGQEEEIASFGSKVALIANSEMDEDTVYQIVKSIMENAEDLETYHPSGKEFTQEGALEGMEIPLHEGAKKYFEEINHPDLQ